jgi:hypothetical protein
MRKFLVKNFVLDYQIKLFGKCYNAPRASRIIFPLFVITGMANALNYDFPTPTTLIWFLYALTALALFFGFIYFHIFPVKFSELDNYQKLLYGSFAFDKLTKKEIKEFEKIKKKYLLNNNC